MYANTISGNVTIEVNKSGKWVPSSNHSNAVIFLSGKGLKKSKTLNPITLDMSNGQFAERVLPVEVGQKVYFKNADDIYHNVWSLSKTKSFDLGSYKAPLKKEVVFDKPGLVKIFCNIHPQMIMTILVLKNNSFYKTSKNGSYKIKDIPPGEYTLRAWVEGSKPVSKKISVEKKKEVKMNFELKQKLLTHHLNKNNKPYSKY